MRGISVSVPIIAASLLGGCFAQTTSRFEEFMPGSILILPPLNESSEVTAPYELDSTMTKPLADKGYYVYPVAMIDGFMKENGLPTPGEMHSVSLKKIDEIIGPDAVLYATVKAWHHPNVATSVLTAIFTRETAPSTVTVDYRLVDVKTGELIWEREQTARADVALPVLAQRCNRIVFQRFVPLGPRHPRYFGPVELAIETTAP